MTHTIHVEDMHCNKCVERIQKSLSETGIKFSVSLDSKTVTIQGCDHCLKTAITELEDLGFTPEVN